MVVSGGLSSRYVKQEALLYIEQFGKIRRTFVVRSRESTVGAC